MKLEFKFIFPPIYGIYDTGDGTIYIFGDQSEEIVVDALNHETLHFVIQKVDGKKSTLRLDYCEPEWLRV